MQLFAITGMNNPKRVIEQADQVFPGRYYVVDNDILLVAASGLTTQEVAQGLGISDEVGGVVQRGIVIAVLAYWGYHDKPLWEWMAVKERAGVY